MLSLISLRNSALSLILLSLSPGSSVAGWEASVGAGGRGVVGMDSDLGDGIWDSVASGW